MTSLIQERNTTQIFDQQVYSLLSLILNKVDCMKMGQASLRLGLVGDLPRLLAMREPSDRPHAQHLKHLTYISRFQPSHQMRQQFKFQPPRPTEPRPQRSEPMEIDQLVQTKNINYQNRLRQTMQLQGKRPA